MVVVDEVVDGRWGYSDEIFTIAIAKIQQRQKIAFYVRKGGHKAVGWLP